MARHLIVTDLVVSKKSICSNNVYVTFDCMIKLKLLRQSTPIPPPRRHCFATWLNLHPSGVSSLIMTNEDSRLKIYVVYSSRSWGKLAVRFSVIRVYSFSM